MADVTIEDQIKAVGREVGLRRHVYPRRVKTMAMEQAEADREIAAMEAAYQTLKWVQKHRARLVALAPELGDEGVT